MNNSIKHEARQSIIYLKFKKTMSYRNATTFIICQLFIFFVLISSIFSQASFNQPRQQITKNQAIKSSDSDACLQTLQTEIDRVLSDKNIQKSKFGIAVYSLTTKKYYYQKNIDLPLTPASNTKLVTCFVALQELGKNFQIKTIVYTDSNKFQDSVLNGNLFIYGRGDPFLSISDIEKLADDVKKLGIKRINGSIYADGSFFDSKTVRKEYSGDAEHVEGTPPITALCFEKNIATILITSGAKPGTSTNVQIIPSSPAFKVSNSSTVSKKGKISVSTKMVDGIQHFFISGCLPPNRTYSYSYYIYNPQLAIAGAFKERLEAGGITIKGDFGIKEISKLDSNKRLYKLSETTRDIKNIIYPVLKKSDNFLAEMLFKLIGAESGKLSDNAAGAKTITKKIMDKYSIFFQGCQLNDGSGLSRRNLLTAKTLVQLLIESEKLDFHHELDSCLAIAGTDGTLRRRMSDTHAYENLHAKTGTLRNASSLAGYVNTIDGERLCFAFIFNGNAVWYYKQAETEIGKTLSQFFYYNVEN